MRLIPSRRRETRRRQVHPRALPLEIGPLSTILGGSGMTRPLVPVRCLPRRQTASARPGELPRDDASVNQPDPGASSPFHGRERLGPRGDRMLVPIAAALGLGIAWLDSRPGYDATGVTAVLLFSGPCARGGFGPTAVAVGRAGRGVDAALRDRWAGRRGLASRPCRHAHRGGHRLRARAPRRLTPPRRRPARVRARGPRTVPGAAARSAGCRAPGAG